MKWKTGWTLQNIVGKLGKKGDKAKTKPERFSFKFSELWTHISNIYDKSKEDTDSDLKLTNIFDNKQREDKTFSLN